MCQFISTQLMIAATDQTRAAVTYLEVVLNAENTTPRGFLLGKHHPHISTQGTEIALRDLIIPISEWKLRLTYLGTVDGPSSRLIVQNIKSDHDETCCRYLNRIVPKNVHILADSSTNRPLTKVVSHSIRRKWCPCFYFNLDGLRTAMLVGDL